jgi:Heparinase II/III-like protein/Heparinase II/III N-terminus
MTSLLWKYNRLKAMGLPEISHRFRKAGQSILERGGMGLAKVPQRAFEGKPSRAWADPMPIKFDSEVSAYLSRADQVLAGKFSVFAMDCADLGFPPDWNRDPRTGTKAPLHFGKTLDYRDEGLVGDIKYLWEPNRHMELVWLAQAWHLSRDERYLVGAKSLLSSWFSQNQYPLGVNWTSSLEHAVRLINWSFAWHLFGGRQSPLLDGAPGQALEEQWMKSVFQHCFFISRHYSKYSSANNHLLGEYAGLFVGATTWPLWGQSTQWLEDARRGLEAQALQQNAPDGGNREQAIWYQHEVADFMLISGLIARANSGDFSDKYWQQLESLLEFIASLLDVGGNMPMIGDSDDAIIVKLAADPDVYRSLLATGAILFSRGDFKAKAGVLDDKTRWLLGDKSIESFDSLPCDIGHLPVKREFRDSGYYILGRDFESRDEIRMVADAGSLGYLSIAAHGHADALSLTLSVGGHEILIDPGTYAYHTQQEWRDYFKGTSAHNTIRVDHLDQSVSGGNFMWTTHAQADCLSFESGADEDVFVGRHNGYMRLPDPVGHQRSVTFNKVDNVFLVHDSLDCSSEHTVEIHWHCGENCSVEICEDLVYIQVEDVRIEMSMRDKTWTPELVTGQENPPLGWVSRRFDRKVPSTTIRWQGKVNSSCQLNTEIKVYRIEA